MDKISVIVPVYNVDRYLHECIDSIISQTYKELEIILIDDGSTDESGQICDRYAQLDSRIIVAHKENGGLSDARNYGLTIATGEWISFVDSDDFISANMLEILICEAEKHNADIAMCAFTYFYDGNVEFDKIYDYSVETYFGRELISEYICKRKSSGISTSVWDRIYRRDLIDDVKFPVGMTHEDIFFTILIFDKCKKAIRINKALYAYRNNRSGQISASYTSEKNTLDRIVLSSQSIDYLLRNGNNYLAGAYTCSFILGNAHIGTKDINIRRQLKVFRRKYKKCILLGIKNDEVEFTNREKFKLILFLISPNAFFTAQTIYLQLKRGNCN